MAFKDKFPKPSFTFLGITCEIADWQTIFFDIQSNKVYFKAVCNLTVGGQPVFLQNVQFSEIIVWPLSQEISINASEFNLTKEGESTMIVAFSIPLVDLEPVLSL